MGKTMRFFGAAIFLCAVAWDFPAKGQDSGQGKALYEQHCTICHGADGKGNGPAAASLNPHPPDLTRPQFWAGGLDKKISETIRNGHGPMPAFSMSASEIDDVISYLKKAFKK